jgi:hypothetical protein
VYGEMQPQARVQAESQSVGQRLTSDGHDAELPLAALAQEDIQQIAGAMAAR